MGIDVSAKLIYGESYGNLLESIDNLDEMLDDGDIDYASPYYDAPRDSWTVGVSIGTVHKNAQLLDAAIRLAKDRFDSISGGVPGKIIACANVF